MTGPDAAAVTADDDLVTYLAAGGEPPADDPGARAVATIRADVHAEPFPILDVDALLAAVDALAQDAPTRPSWGLVLAMGALWLLVAVAIVLAFTFIVGACGAQAPA